MRHTTANSSFGCEKIYEEVLRQRLFCFAEVKVGSILLAE